MMRFAICWREKVDHWEGVGGGVILRYQRECASLPLIRQLRATLPLVSEDDPITDALPVIQTWFAVLERKRLGNYHEVGC